LYIAEIVGKAGIYSLKKALPEIRRNRGVDFVVACADGATGGAGLGRNHAAYIRKLGVDVLTTGDYSFYKKDLVENIGKMPYVLRPANLNANAPGWGAGFFRPAAGKWPWPAFSAKPVSTASTPTAPSPLCRNWWSVCGGKPPS
jgi:calcineurin-like phosphoesterase